MNIQPRIEKLSEKKLVGIHLTMNLVRNRTGELWSSFMPRRSEITNSLSPDLFSLQVYAPDHFRSFNPEREFEKWALTEVADFENIPKEMEPFVLSEGTYAVFDYKGLNTDPSIFRYIYSEWLPGSNYLLDDRPHFEVLGARYRNNDPESEEEIWIPVRPKSR